MPRRNIEEGLVAYEFGYVRGDAAFWRGQRVRALKSEFKPGWTGDDEPTKVFISPSLGGQAYLITIESVGWDNPGLNAVSCDCGTGENCRICETDNQPPLDACSGDCDCDGSCGEHGVCPGCCD